MTITEPWDIYGLRMDGQLPAIALLEREFRCCDYEKLELKATRYLADSPFWNYPVVFAVNPRNGFIFAYQGHPIRKAYSLYSDALNGVLDWSASNPNVLPKIIEDKCSKALWVTPLNQEESDHHQIIADLRAEHETVTCTVCNAQTTNRGTKLCDPCWELKTRIERDPEKAATILAALFPITPPKP